MTDPHAGNETPAVGRARDEVENDRGDTPSVVFLFGPTAGGKTQLLIDLFQHWIDAPGEVISADSMQVYRHMDIGTAKPSAAERAALAHHLIDMKDPKEGYHVGEFVTAAEGLIREIRGRGAVPVIAGGTAFYFRSFLYGLPGTPRASERTRGILRERLEAEGLPALHRELAERDPASAEAIAPRDSYRILRALEILYETGTPRSEFAPAPEPRDDVRVLILGLYRERSELYRRINARVERMMAAGLPEELRRLTEMGYRAADPGMRAIGYREFFRADDSGPDDSGPQLRALPEELPAIAEEIQRNSRRYAKRQLTFFRKLPDVQWFTPDQVADLAACLRGFLRGAVRPYRGKH